MANQSYQSYQSHYPHVHTLPPSPPASAHHHHHHHHHYHHHHHINPQLAMAKTSDGPSPHANTPFHLLAPTVSPPAVLASTSNSSSSSSLRISDLLSNPRDTSVQQQPLPPPPPSHPSRVEKSKHHPSRRKRLSHDKADKLDKSALSSQDLLSITGYALSSSGAPPSSSHYLPPMTFSRTHSLSPTFASPSESSLPSTVPSPAAESSSSSISGPTPISVSSSYISNLVNLEQQMRSKQTAVAATSSWSDSYISQLERLETAEVEKTRANAHHMHQSSDTTPTATITTTAQGTALWRTMQAHQHYIDMCVPCLTRHPRANWIWATLVPQLALSSDLVSDALTAYTTITMDRFFGESRDKTWFPVGKQAFERSLDELVKTPAPTPQEVEAVYVSIVLATHYVLLRPTAVPLVAESDQDVDFFRFLQAPFMDTVLTAINAHGSQFRHLLEDDVGPSGADHATHEYLELVRELIELATQDITKARLFHAEKGTASSLPIYMVLSPDEKQLFLSCISTLSQSLNLALQGKTIHLLKAFSLLPPKFYDLLRSRHPLALILASYTISIFATFYIKTSGGIFGKDTRQFESSVLELESLLPYCWRGAVYWSRRTVQGCNLEGVEVLKGYKDIAERFE